MAEGDRVRIRIHGRQRDDAGALHESRTQAVGRHDAKGGKHFFRYEDHALLEGYGTSKGIDFFFENHSLVKNLTATVSYAFNDSERLYLDYTSLRAPEYASRHNIRLTAKYSIGKMIFGVAESYASGRKFTSGTTPYYNSVDANLTWLVSPKVIVYTSINNILGRTNVFGFQSDGLPQTASRDRFFYIGIFVSLKNNKAYDISNF